MEERGGGKEGSEWRVEGAVSYTFTGTTSRGQGRLFDDETIGPVANGDGSPNIVFFHGEGSKGGEESAQ